MNEARFSINTKFNVEGFDSQLTIRGDESLIALLKLHNEALRTLINQGAVPEQRRENTKKPTTPAEPKIPTCRHCGQSDAIELIEFTKNGKPRAEWKCQRCNKWHYENNKGG